MSSSGLFVIFELGPAMALFYTKVVALLCPEERVGESEKKRKHLERWIELIPSERKTDRYGQLI